MAIKRSQRLIAFSLFIILIYLFILQVKAVWPFTIDDMYISLRYAKHWWAGYGLVWNIGAPPVEGYSNFSFVVLARLVLSLGYDPVLVLKGVGVIGLFCTGLALYAIARLWFLPLLAIIPCLWLLAYKGQILWSVSGLETTVYEALICGAVFLMFHGLGYLFYPKPKGHLKPIFFILAGLLLSLAGMTRPEAPALMILFTLLLLADKSQYPRVEFNRCFVLFCSTFFIFFVPYFLWRWHYYGRLFPNPVYCKGLTNAVLTLDKNYLRLIWPFALLALLALWQKRDNRYYFLSLPSLLYLLLLIGADPIVAFDNRLFLIAFALLLPLAFIGIKSIISWYLIKKDELFNLAMYLGSFLLAFFFIPMLSLTGYQQFTENPLAGEHLRKNVVGWLDKNVAPNSQVVLADSGLIPYQSSHQFIDSYCLNNAEMTKMPATTMYEQLCDQVIQSKPNVIILTSLIQNGKTIYTPTDACLAEKLIKESHYCLQTNISTGNDKSLYRYEIFKNC